MSKEQIKKLIKRRLPEAGLLDTALKGVKLFHVTEAIPCLPAIYEPTVVAILSGSKEAVLDGEHHVYGSNKYLLCPMTLPVEAGAPMASKNNPLLGVMIAMEPRMMRVLAMEIEATAGGIRQSRDSAPSALALASWDDGFTQALLRLLDLLDNPVDLDVLGQGRLRELYYAVLMDRRFKEATTMSPIQFVKSMRLNHAAMKIAEGKTVSEAAWDVGYQSASQFSREFKRMYGQSPRQWSNTAHAPEQLN